MSCSGNKEEVEKKQEIPVKVLTVESSDIGYQQNYVGTMEETLSSSLSFLVAGNVSNIHIREGQKVSKGQLLASLDKATFQSSYDAALSSLHQAEDAYSRMKVLYENNSLPEIKWIEIQTSLQQAKSVESIARKKLDDCCLYAPFTGVIAERNIESGTNVMPGMPAFRLITIDKIKVRVAIPEKEISQIHVGQPVSINIMALSGKSVEGKISEKGVTANPLSHTYEIKILLNNNDGDFMPGMVCNVTIDTENESKKGIILPSNTVQTGHDGRKFVWLVNNNQAQRREVYTNGFADNGVIISGGLFSGEQVITEGYQKVSEGMKIVVR